MPKLRLLPVLGSVYLSPLDQLFSFLSSALSSSILCSTLNFDRDVVLRTTRPLQRVIPTVTAVGLRSFPVTSNPSVYRLNRRSGQSQFLGCCPPILHPHFLVISSGPCIPVINCHLGQNYPIHWGDWTSGVGWSCHQYC